MRNEIPELRPGDLLLYSPNSLIGRIICIKTWSHVCHCEIYVGSGQSVASRDGIGVGIYHRRVMQLAAVLRPDAKLQPDMVEAKAWFYKVANGQKYDFLGLCCFFLAAKRGSQDRMFCSEFAVNFYRAGGFNPVHHHWSADKVAPGDFMMATPFDWIWKNFDP